MSGHTPGPWTFYDDSNDGKTNRIEIVAIGKTIAHIYHSVPAKDLPNARLIAAAPDMLVALRRAALALAFAAETSEAMLDDYNAVSDAISKATRET